MNEVRVFNLSFEWQPSTIHENHSKRKPVRTAQHPPNAAHRATRGETGAGEVGERRMSKQPVCSAAAPP
jgi:hypothetical protein